MCGHIKFKLNKRIRRYTYISNSHTS